MDVLLISSYAVSKYLHREQDPRRRGEATEAGYLENRRGPWIVTGEESLDSVVEPSRRELELLGDLRRRFIDGGLGSNTASMSRVERRVS
jgi:hypothetical protein